MLQTKVDAQRDKLATEKVDNAGDGRRFRVVASYSSKLANLTYPPTFRASVGGDPRLSFAEIFGARKLESMAYRMALFA